ncbi:bacteriohopanetetrol glucosamine biosynthesis glycosyltransferase HpnI [Massilia sp. 9096]|uniref:bacteriohopanetetrol glucosamine biosynthesis glycosyltransferase HpnI n=1 Tax=Massilia sp. 9096 TaxID=1500894 RepID=UPI00068D3B12|nr:bacteriohopanetetrol glucosamine biosynthesis glycosyltransferase HpnI [Massilia sp. 9096]
MPLAFTVAGTLLTTLATLYGLAALLCRPRTWTRAGAGASAGARPDLARQPVTVLKPLCGFEARLEANLDTLCRQTHPHYQIVFGVRAADDPAIAVVRRLQARYPAVDMELVVDPRVHGGNLKVSNLINMMAAARHPWLVLADSDIAVDADYLERVSAPLADPQAGIVTCLYRGIPEGGLWSRVGALFIDTWFAPSVAVASRGGSSEFGFGATIALRLDALRAIGGFEVLKDRLADDFWLGELTRRQGLRTVLSDVVVGTDVTEQSLQALWRRERRWMQTIRSLNGPGYAFCFVTFTLPMLVLGLLLAPAWWNALVGALGLAARVLLQRRAAPGIGLLLAPLRDGLLLLEWLSGFAGATTRWREHRLAVDRRSESHSTPKPIPQPDRITQKT